jgi:phosphatidylserine/phosphatidylglycerophosphate/cardiolipin synthase-like enzyme
VRVWAVIMSNPLEVTFLRDTHHGGTSSQPQDVADQLAAFIDAATQSVDIAIYDFRLSDPSLVSTVIGALKQAADRGVTVRIGYDAGKPATATAATFAAIQADPAPPGTGDFLQGQLGGTPVQLEPIKAGGQLMHSKYVLRDAGTTKAAVWTGSTNFTDDAWTRQENNIITVHNHTMAASYEADFNQMWSTGTITGAGLHGSGHARPGGHALGWDFCPGDGPAVNTALAARVHGAKERLVIAAKVLTSHEVLGALATAVGKGIPLTGIYDSGQMNPIVKEWKANPNNTAVVAAWETVSAQLHHKSSVPYTPTGVHNFMHLKVLLTDDVLTTGSYNFSANAEHNAENQLHTSDPATVTAYGDYLATVISAYPHL